MPFSKRLLPLLLITLITPQIHASWFDWLWSSSTPTSATAQPAASTPPQPATQAATSSSLWTKIGLGAAALGLGYLGYKGYQASNKDDFKKKHPWLRSIFKYSLYGAAPLALTFKGMSYLTRNNYIPENAGGYIQSIATGCILGGNMISIVQDIRNNETENNTKESNDLTVTETLKDYVGKIPDEVMHIIEYLKDSQIRKNYQLLNIKPYKGILFTGPPGSGKTSLARCIAGETRVPFYSIKIPDVIKPAVGASEASIRNIFNNIKDIASNHGTKTAILFLDEIDAIGAFRTNGQGEASRAHASMVNTLLAEIDGFDSFNTQSTIIVMASTNRPEVLDTALTRPGRFDVSITIDLPHEQKQRQLFAHYLSKTRYEHNTNEDAKNTLIERVLSKVPQEEIKEVSPSDLKFIVEQAARETAHNGNLENLVVTDQTLLTIADTFFKKKFKVKSYYNHLMVKEKLADYIGKVPKEVKYIIEYLRNPLKRDYYKSLSVKPYKGIIFTGPPGSGKTSLARCIAGEAGVPFYSIKIPDIVKSAVGGSDASICAIFANIKQIASNHETKTAILFLDEIDAIGATRTNKEGEASRSHASMVNTLLGEIDGIDSSNTGANIIIMATTNRPEVLDKALTRPGRLDITIHIDLPDIKKQKILLAYYLSKTRYEHNNNDQAKNALIEKILKEVPQQQTKETSPADLKWIVEQAARETAHKSNSEDLIVTDKMLLATAEKFFKKKFKSKSNEHLSMYV